MAGKHRETGHFNSVKKSAGSCNSPNLQAAAQIWVGAAWGRHQDHIWGDRNAWSSDIPKKKLRHSAKVGYRR